MNDTTDAPVKGKRAVVKKKKHRPDKVYDGKNPNICDDCGFHVRGKGHGDGVHHNGGKGGKYDPT